MNPNLILSLDRADELLKDAMVEYDQSLRSKSVSLRAVHLTHEVCERLRSVLDRLARLYWETHVSPRLLPDDKKAAAIYFPIASNQQGFDSILGRWRWKTVREQHQPMYNFFLKLQPFQDPKNKWLSILNDLAVQGKHIDLVPQKRTEEQRITVTGSGGGSVSWGAGVVFGSGVSIMGAPVDPRTQRIVPTQGVTERVELWVSFVIDSHGVNAAGFCQEACGNTRSIATDMTKQFGLS